MTALLWLRPLWQRPRRALAAVLGVAIGVAAVVSTGLASRAAVASLTADVEALAGAARLEVTRPGGVPIADIGRLRPFAGEVCVSPVVEGTAFVPARRELVRLLGVDGLAAGDSTGIPFPLQNGTDARLGEDFLRGNGVLLARSAAHWLGVAAGEELELVVRSTRVSLRVLALFEPERLASAWERVLVLDVALAQELLGRTEYVDRLELIPRLGRVDFDEEELAARIRAALPEGVRVGPASMRREEGERFVRSLSFNLTALAGVSVLVAIVLVATTLATSVVQRRKGIALLRSLGASRVQLALAVLVEAAAIGLLGGALGVALGALGARLIAADVHGSFATLSEDILLGAVELEPGWAVAGLALGFVTALFAAFLPLQETWRTPPLQNLRGDGPIDETRVSWTLRLALVLALGLAGSASARLPPWHELPIWALVSGLCWLAIAIVASGPLVATLARAPTGFLGIRAGTPVRLAQAALGSALRRAAWAASAVGVAVALSVSMTTLVGSFRSNLVDWTQETMKADLHVRPLATASGTVAGRLAPEVLAIARELFGREQVEPYHEAAASVDGRRIALGGGEFAVLARVGGVPFLDGRPSTEVFRAALELGGALVNEPFARRFGLWRGERVRITGASGTIEREIVGVYRDFSGQEGRVVLDLDDFGEVQPVEGAESIDIHLAADADTTRARERLVAALGGRFELEILRGSEVRAEWLRVFERTFAVTRALQGIASVVAALAVVLVLLALVSERARDLAVVRVLGGSRRQLGALVAFQALFLGLAGVLSGLSAGVVIGYVLVAVVNVQSFGWSLRFTLPPAVLWSAGAVVPVCLAAGLVPAWISLRAPPQEVLREAD